MSEPKPRLSFKRILYVVAAAIAIAVAVAGIGYAGAHAYAGARAEAACAKMDWGRAIVTYDFSATYCVTVYGGQEIVAPLHAVEELYLQQQLPGGNGG